jgi:hypothetical protein
MDKEDILVGIAIVLCLAAIFLLAPVAIGYVIWMALGPIGFWQSLAALIFILVAIGGYLVTVVMVIAVALG